VAHENDKVLPDVLRNQLGRLAFYFQLMERATLNLLWRRFGMHSELEAKAILLLEGMQYTRILEKVEPIYVADFGEDDSRIVDLRALLKRARGANEDRNRLLHAGWFGLPPHRLRETTMYRAKRVKEIKDARTLASVDVAEIERAADCCAQVAQELFEISKKFDQQNDATR